MTPTTIPTASNHRWTFVPLGLLAVGWVASQYLYWGISSDAWDHYLVNAAAFWAFTLAWPQFRAVKAVPQPIIGLLIALPTLVILPLAWYFTLSDTRGRSYLLWYQWFGLLLLSLGYFVSLAGLHATRRLLFPLLVLVLSLPVPSLIMNPIQAQLQQITAVSSEATLKLIGENVTRRGFVLTLPQGELGVAEACSGVKSLFSLAALGAFLAYYRLLSLPRAAMQMTIVLPVVLMVNILRVVLCGWIQEHIGRQYIIGAWHDALSYGLLPIGVLMLWLVSGWLKPRVTLSEEAVSSSTALRVSPMNFWYSVIIVVLSVAAGVYGQSQSIPHSLMPKLESFPMQLPGGWIDCTDIGVEQEMHDQLHDSTSFHRIYRNDIGQRVIVWVVGWDSASLISGYHHPDICLPNAGFREERRWIESVRLNNGATINLTGRQMQSSSGELGVLYWSQEGSRVWTNDDETNASRLLGHKALIQRLNDLIEGKPPLKPERRLMVSIATSNTTKSGYIELAGFAKSLAEALQAHDEELRINPQLP